MLGKNYYGTKNRLVIKQLLAIRDSKNGPILETFVDSLLPVPHPLLDCCPDRIFIN